MAHHDDVFKWFGTKHQVIQGQFCSQSFPSDHLEIWQNSHVNFPAFYASRCEFTCDFLASQTQQLGSHQKPLDKKSTRLGNHHRRFFKHGSKSLGDVEVIATTTGWTLHDVKRCGPTFGADWCWPGYRQVLPHRRWWPCWNLLKTGGEMIEIW